MRDNILHLLFKRQIPDHIQSSYPLFVDFLKAYQEFLQQTQAQELEKFRDIDEVTDEFVGRFVSELADRIKVDDLQDKRMFLKHLREFYLSKGSEASYKFIFRTFFNKNVDITYPSQQILRVSDGKWKQEVSIFVKNTSTASNLFPLNGKYIIIKSGKKTIRTYVENVLRYSNDVFELLVQRDIVRNLEVGSTVEYVEGTTNYSGVILLAPKSIKILKKGRGFRIGDLYNLKTNIGDGCVIKVTQIDGSGGILKAKILKFSLDYTEDFISSIHKDKTLDPSFTFTSSGSPKNMNMSINEYTSDNISEGGFLSRQTYMFYDSSIPIPNESSDAGSRFFASGDYVGEVISQFYEDNPARATEEDFAEILVKVGPCSVYSGYYLAQDGFISDEVYIQDGDYYQTFSYVIKVQEELSKYADLIKSILHPAGMKMFAEQQIYNNIDISVTSVFKNRVLQFASGTSISDSGSNYSSYNITYDGEIPSFTPANNASILFAPDGKIAYILHKRVADPVSSNDSDPIKHVGKITSSPSSVTDDTNPPKDVVKTNIQSVISNLLEEVKKQLETTFNVSTATAVDDAVPIRKEYGKLTSSPVSLSDNDIRKEVSKVTSSQEIQTSSTLNPFTIGKSLNHLVGSTDDFPGAISKIFSFSNFNHSVNLDDNQFSISRVTILSFSSQVNPLSSNINMTLATTIPTSFVSISSGINTKTIDKTQIASAASTEDSGALVLNSYDIDYFYPNAVGYQSNTISIT